MIIVIPGNPPSKDNHWKPVVRRAKNGKVFPAIGLTPEGTKFRHAVRNHIRGLLDSGEQFPEGPLYALRIAAYVVKMRHLDEVSVPWRDIDSCISPTMDALEFAGVFGSDQDADVRVEHLYPPERYKDSKNPRIEIEVTTWTKS